MSRICPKCNFENQDDWDFCAKCGNKLADDSDYPYEVFKPAILITYVITILLSWSGVILAIISKATSMGVFAFFGFFMPFFLIQSNSRKIRIHGYIQLIISLIGSLLTLYLIF